MALLTGLSKAPSYPSGRYAHTNPLRREAGLRLLTRDLPDPVRWLIIRHWRRPGFPTDKAVPQSLQQAQGQRPDANALMQFTPRSLCWFSFTELEIARRLVEASQESMRPAMRNSLLIGQGVYLRQLYIALARQIGEAAALAEFQSLVAGVY